MLNIIWIFFFLAAFFTALFKMAFLGDQQVFAQIMDAMFSLSKSAFEISLGLTGVLALWLGIMKIGERSGFIQLLTQSLTPLFSRLMPDVPKGHPALGAIVMNISANALGLDNAATPLGFTLIVGGLSGYFFSLPQAQMLQQSAIISNVILFFLVIGFILGALYKGINAYDAFIEGAKEGFQTAILIIPYLVAMLVAIGVFRASGALDLLADLARVIVHHFMLDDRFVDALPTALIKPVSGSGARAMMIDTMKTHGADSFAGRLASIVQGSTETTFYVLAIYFGSVGIKRIRHAAACGIIADFAGIAAAICVAYWFFG